MRVALGVEYDGTHFSGWQIQPQQRTVQSSLNEALAVVANHPVKTVAAGRTDSGVHALQQVVHFDTVSDRKAHNWILGLNTNLPKDINVVWAKSVSDDFSARFSAVKRSYRYLILNRDSRSAIQNKRAWWYFKKLDSKRMQAAADLLEGHHDFSAFRAKECQAKNPFKTVESITVTQTDNYIAIDVKAQSFLHHMVRNIVGVLVAIGEGSQDIRWAEQVLASKDRALGGITSPPEGLYFVNVEYPAIYELPAVSAFPVVW